MSWLETEGETAVLKVAVLASDEWQAAREVARGVNWFVNWADFPSVVPLDNDRWLAHWLVRNPHGQFAYDVFVAHSDDRGTSWGQPRLLHDDGTATEHGFVSIVAADSGADIVWLDGRDIAQDTNEASMTLRTARLVGTEIRTQSVVDSRVCDCCQTDAARTKSGTIIVYRDRSDDEIRDISSIRSIDGHWAEPVAVAEDGWRITGCPVNGPAVDADGDEVVVAWPTGTGSDARVRWSRSDDGGANFRNPVDVDTEDPIGRVDVALLDDNRTVVSWMRRKGEEAVLSIRTVAEDGALGEVYDVTAMGSSRASGFPQMVATRDRLMFAWTDIDGASPRVRTASTELP